MCVCSHDIYDNDDDDGDYLGDDDDDDDVQVILPLA